VKNWIKNGSFEDEPQKDEFGRYQCPLKAINKKPIQPSEEEIIVNNRARSAKLRIAEKV
jgi:16S rRNA (cytosine1402-N4)-methyltransferase